MDAGAPAVLVAFANDHRPGGRLLRDLYEESNAIHDALMSRHAAGVLAPLPAVFNATIDSLLAAFRGPYRDRICVFHFGGHADGASLLLETSDGGPMAAHANGLAGYLGQQAGLVLVFLNGCCTAPQIGALRAA